MFLPHGTPLQYSIVFGGGFAAVRSCEVDFLLGSDLPLVLAHHPHVENDSLHRFVHRRHRSKQFYSHNLDKEMFL